MEEKEIGHVIHYFTAINVAAIELTADGLKIGDTIHVKGHTSDFTQSVKSMQVEHKNVEEAKSGDTVGLKVTEHAREQDIVYKILE